MAEWTKDEIGAALMTGLETPSANMGETNGRPDMKF